MIKKKYKQHRETIDNFFWRFLQLGFKQGTVFLIFFISAKFLLPEDFGMLNYLMAIIALFMIFCDFGLSSSISKYSAEYKNKESHKLPDLLNSSLLVIFSMSFVISLIILIFGNNIVGDNSLLYFIPYIFLYPITSLFDGYYRGIKEFKKISIITMITGIVSIILSFILIKEYLFIGAIISQNVFFALLGISFFIIKGKSKINFNKKLAKTVMTYGVVIGAINILFFLYTKADIIILKYFGYIIEIGYYEIVNKVFAMILIPFMIIGQVIAPNITKLYSDKKYNLVKIKFWKHLVFFSLVSVILCIVLYFIFPPIIENYLFKYFTPNTLLIFKYMLLILPLRLVGVVITHSQIVPTGNAKISMWMMIPGAILNIILDVIFIKLFGFLGVIYSTLICSFFTILLTIFLYSIKLRNMSKGTGKIK